MGHRLQCPVRKQRRMQEVPTLKPARRSTGAPPCCASVSARRLLHSAAGACEKGPRSGRVTDLVVELRQPQCPRGIVSRREPESGGMIGEGCRMSQNQFVVALLGILAPGLRLV